MINSAAREVVYQNYHLSLWVTGFTGAPRDLAIAAVGGELHPRECHFAR